jgi:hypothetical protein
MPARPQRHHFFAWHGRKVPIESCFIVRHRIHRPSNAQGPRHNCYGQLHQQLNLSCNEVHSKRAISTPSRVAVSSYGPGAAANFHPGAFFAPNTARREFRLAWSPARRLAFSQKGTLRVRGGFFFRLTFVGRHVGGIRRTPTGFKDCEGTVL